MVTDENKKKKESKTYRKEKLWKITRKLWKQEYNVKINDKKMDMLIEEEKENKKIQKRERVGKKNTKRTNKDRGKSYKIKW